MVVVPFIIGAFPATAYATSAIAIDNCTELQLIGYDEGYPIDGDYILSGNIDCSATNTWNEDEGDPGTFFGFLPINGGESGGFNGSFDGNGKTISDLYIRRPGDSSVGLFGALNDSGEVFNLTLTGVDITGNGDVGAVVGYNILGSLTNVSVVGDVEGSGDNVGGLVGNNDQGTLISITTDVTVTAATGTRSGGIVGRNAIGSIIKESHALGDVDGNDNAGGLVGAGGGLIVNSYATGSVTGDDGIGGLAGRNGGTFINTYATGNASGNDDVGGLLGYQDNGVMVNSHAEGDVTGSGNNSGGLVGRNAGGSTIVFSYATGEIHGASRVGGIAGANGGDIENSYAWGAVTGNSNVGGISGRCGGDISDSYSVGAVTGTSTKGGLLGFTDGCDVTSSFWDTQTSGRATSAAGVGHTTTEMKTESTFTDEGWNFDDTWYMDVASYPQLFQNEIFDSGEATVTEPYVITNCSELQNVGFLEDGYFELANDIDCSATANWNNFDEPNYYVSNGDGVTTEFTLPIQQVRTDRDFTAFINSVEQNTEDYTVDYESDHVTVTFDSPPPDGENVAFGFSFYEGFKPIGFDTDEFQGHFDGDGHTIDGLYINRPYDGYIGLFSETDDEAHVKNIVVTDANITGEYRVGILIGENDGRIEKSGSTGSVYSSDDDQIGGLVGANTSDGVITQSYSSATVRGRSRVGGLTGANGGSIDNSYARGSVSGEDNVGGLAGRCGGEISASYATGSVEGHADIGGLVGYEDGCDTADSFWDTETSGQAESAVGEGKTTEQLRTQAELPFSEAEPYDLQEASGDVAYRYIKWDITGTKSESEQVQASEFELYNHGAAIDWPNTITTQSPDASDEESTEEGSNALIDKAIWTKWLDYNYATNENESFVIFDAGAGNTLTFDAYTWITGNDETYRDPATWNLYGSTDGESWMLLDSRTNVEVTDERNMYVTPLATGYDFVNIWGVNADENSGYPFFKWQGFDSTGDSDGDGISDASEDAGPNGGDANNDGTLDSEQDNVTAFIDPVTGEFAALEANDECTNDSVSIASEASKSVQDAGFDYPAGLMSFTLDCNTLGFTATVSQYFYGIDASDLVLRKYNDVTHTYSAIAVATAEQLTIDGKQVAKVTYQITDGSSLDEDASENGVIVDPTGLGNNAVGAPNTGLGGGAH